MQVLYIYIYIILFNLPRKVRIPTPELALSVLFPALIKRTQSGGGCYNLSGKGKGLNYGGDGRNEEGEMGSSYIQAIKIGKFNVVGKEILKSKKTFR